MANSVYLTGVCKESKQIWKLAAQTILTQFLLSVPCTLMFMFAGHVSNEDLDVVGLGTAFIFSTAYSASIGIGVACEVLLSQTYGSTKRTSLGIIVQRCLVIACLVFLLSGTLAAQFKWIVFLMGYRGTFITKFRSFILATIPGYFGFSVLVIEMKYLQCQKIVKPCIITGAIVNILHIAYGIPLTWYSGLGVIGTGLAFSITYWLWALFLFIYINVKKLHEATWCPWSMECLTNWSRIVKVTVPSIAMVALEYMLFEAFIILCAQLGEYYLGIFLIAMNVNELVFNLSIGTASAVIIQIGNHLGKGDSENAKISAVASAFVSVGVSLSGAIVIIASYYVTPYLYSNDPYIIQDSRPLVIIMSVIQLFNGVFYINSGIIRACNNQRFPLVTSIIGFGVIGISLASILMFWLSLNVYGLLIAILISMMFLFVVNSVKAYCINWDKEAESAIKLAHKSTKVFNEISTEGINGESTQLVQGETMKRHVIIKVLVIFLLFISIFIISIVFSLKY